MKTYKLLLLSLGVFCFTACEKELDRDLTDANVSVATDENVRYEGNILTVKKGTPIINMSIEIGKNIRLKMLNRVS